jgi:hypothetical protein
MSLAKGTGVLLDETVGSRARARLASCRPYGTGVRLDFFPALTRWANEFRRSAAAGLLLRMFYACLPTTALLGSRSHHSAGIAEHTPSRSRVRSGSRLRRGGRCLPGSVGDLYDAAFILPDITRMTSQHWAGAEG